MIASSDPKILLLKKPLTYYPLALELPLILSQQVVVLLLLAQKLVLLLLLLEELVLG